MFTPMVPGQKLIHDGNTFLENVGVYIRLVGRLLYLNATRPDIVYVVQQLS